MKKTIIISVARAGLVCGKSFAHSESRPDLQKGFATFFNDHMALEPNLSYRGHSLKENKTDSDFTYNTGQVVIGLGLSIHRGRKSHLAYVD
jgi:hypothetical protein